MTALLIMELHPRGMDRNQVELESHLKSQVLEDLIFELLPESFQGPVGLEGIAFPARRKVVRDVVNSTRSDRDDMVHME